MKTTLLAPALSLALIGAAHAQSLQTATISAGAARLSNGSLVNIGQPLVGLMFTANNSLNLNVGIIPAVVQPPDPPPDQPLRIEPPILANGLFQMKFSTSPGRNYVVHASTNLADWFPLWTNSAFGLDLFTDPETKSFNHRFYRVVVP